MDEILYNALSSYYNALANLGYMSASNSRKLLVLAFYRDFIMSDYRGLISQEDYHLIEKALNCLYGSTCLIPYPNYLKSGKWDLSKVSMTAQKIRALEDSEVVKVLYDEETTDDSDVIITGGETIIDVTFSITPTTIFTKEISTLVFKATASEECTMSILNPSGNVIYSENNTTSINYRAKILTLLAGVGVYTLVAQEGRSKTTATVSVTAKDAEYHTMYYGNSSEELSDAASIQSLSSSRSNSASDTYNNKYYYIAVHSSKTLVSVINRGVENVTENFILKNDALVLTEYGSEQTYKLYECNINADAEEDDMYTFNLTITIN